ncbi:MAG: family 20 glycosylhydrolase [Bacteroidales bacterium]
MKKLKVIVALLAVTTITLSCRQEQKSRSYNEGINVIPVPLELSVTDTLTKYTLNKNSRIVVSSPDLAQPAAFLASKIKSSTGYDLKISDKESNNSISIILNTRVGVGNEGYLLKSTSNGVIIEARTPQGAFYAIQTLLQLLPAEIESKNIVKGIEWSIPSVSIKDEPAFKYRGLMLDVCRHFASVDYIKKQLDILAMFKMNRFHWHLTEDQAWRIEIKQYPKLTEMGSHRIDGDGTKYGPFFYTQEDIKEVVAYASERFIDVIPEIELPGHALAALIAYPEYSCTGGPFEQPRIIWGVEEDVYCVGNKETFVFLENIITEVANLFPSEYFHIGGDECPKVRWRECPKCQSLAKDLNLKVKDGHSVEEQLQSYAVTRIERHLSSLGKKMIGWDEILEGGLAPGAIVMSWRGESGGIAAANSDHEVIMTPGSGGMYIDFLQGAVEVEPTAIGGYAPLEKTYSYNPIPKNLPEDKHKYILGAQANMWTEYCLDEATMDYMIYPRVIAVAEVTWSSASRKNWDSFAKRINNAYARLDSYDVNYHIPMPEGTVTSNIVFTDDTTSVSFNNTRNLPMVYTLDGSEPTAKSDIYEAAIVVSEDSDIKIATLLPTGKMSRSRTIKAERRELLPAVIPDETLNLNLPEGFKAGQGTVIRVAEGLFTTNQAIEGANFGEPIIAKFFTGSNSNAPKFDMNKPGVVVYEGYIDFPEDGVYTFATDMDQLWIDGELLVENEKLSRHNKTKAQIGLEKGKHTYKLVFNNYIKDGWPNSWSPVGFRFKTPSSSSFQNVTPEMLSL